MNAPRPNLRIAAIVRLWALVALAATAAGCRAVQDYPEQLRVTAESAELLGRDITGQRDPEY